MSLIDRWNIEDEACDRREYREKAEKVAEAVAELLTFDERAGRLSRDDREVMGILHTAAKRFAERMD
jgi:hypothetical protein